MARVTHVKKAQASKKARRCTRCGTEIKPGDSYRWFATRIGRSSQRKNFCSGCQIRPSDQTSSHHLQTLYSATEGAEDALCGDDLSLSDIADILRSCGEAVKEVGEGYQESADAIEEGFGHSTYQSEEIAEKAQELETFGDDLDSAADDIESLDDPDEEAASILADFEGETDDDGKPVDEDEGDEFVQSVREERRENAVGAANDALCNCPM